MQITRVPPNEQYSNKVENQRLWLCVKNNNTVHLMNAAHSARRPLISGTSQSA